MVKVAIYVRVSTTKQECENQLLQLREYCTKSEYHVFKEYTDVISGKEDHRPLWDQLFCDAHKKLFDVVLFWDLSRFSRSGTLYTLQKLKELENLGIGIISYQEPYINSTGMFKDVLISILATIAKIEREQISERTRAGLQRAQQRGVRLGRPGLSVRKTREIQRLHKLGWTIPRIHKKTKVSVGKVHEIKTKMLSEKEE